MDEARVECSDGTFIGTLDRGMASFRGIPFTGEPPTGENRWMPPVPFEDGPRTHDATRFRPAPPQRTGGRFAADEDCLYLNVWTDISVEAGRKPVVFWIHGGSFTSGSTSHPLYSGEGFVRESPDIVFVSAGYRLGALGFMDVSAVPGGEGLSDSANLGLMDLGMALEWVHRNIQAFGGDPDNITLMGQSAGAACAVLLASNERYGSRVRRVIAQSGSPAFTVGPDRSPAVGAHVARSLGCRSVEELRSVPAETLGELSDSLSMKVWPVRSGMTVPTDPYRELEKRRIDILAGSNLNEMDTFASYMGKEMLMETTRKAVSSLPEASRRQLSDYLGSGEDLGRYLALGNWSLFSGPAEALALCATASGGKGYRYLWKAPTGRPGYGAYHGAELPAVLGNGSSPGYERIAAEAHRMWAEFARSGVPSDSWPVCDRDGKEYMVVGEAGFSTGEEPLPETVRWLERRYML